ncbi:alpha/beta fold hydrolase [Geodermatophilus siccatus]|uniref:alpha/beta fold hydrolase n=1 Tax=Geodermatophilus siccatus TaxID=1137991 RepID=UPI003CCB8E7C
MRLHVVERGDPGGPPVALLHGWPDSWSSWSRVLAHLDPRLRAVAYGQRGFGDSDHPAGGHPLDRFADDLLALCDALGLGRVHLVGHSSGSFVVRRVAEQHPTGSTGWRSSARPTGWATSWSRRCGRPSPTCPSRCPTASRGSPPPAPCTARWHRTSPTRSSPRAARHPGRSTATPGRGWSASTTPVGSATSRHPRCCCGATPTPCSTAASRTGSWPRSPTPGCASTRTRALPRWERREDVAADLDAVLLPSRPPRPGPSSPV